MKLIPECEQAISELTEKIDSAQIAISEKQREADDLRERNTKLVEANLHKERMPKSLGAQRQEIARLDLQIEELRSVQASLQERLVKAKEELSYAKLFERVQMFKKFEETFSVTMEETLCCLKEISKNIETLKKQLVQLRSYNHPLHLLVPILKDLNGNVSYEAFILRGELTHPNSKDNAYIDSVIKKYRSLRNQVPELPGDLNQLGSILGNQLSYISGQASELRHFRRKEG